LQDLLHAQFFAAVNPPSKEQEQMHQ
jgi:hypothetical protein